ncbi:PKD domain-containing protein [Salinarchaeum sp. Harcht-Bsk1]|uniref:PKD domain-containing protein n=1 Tax=Salinarchaeum sp. Harcht-Bsk1 TaxID=1333523 RepID=UPI00165144C4|nr:PKD domain-containing protein [Salinarchaeum sp. Harcht-Bsk1]
MTVDRTPPTVATVRGNRTVDEDTAVAFDGTNSTDGVGVANYSWVFGDGATATGETVSHAFADPGTYTVTLTATDVAGNANATNLTVTVEDVPENTGGGGFRPLPDTTDPTADAGRDRTVTTGTAFSFDGTNSTDDVEITAYLWDVDGDGATELTGPEPTYRFQNSGTYDVTLTVSDRNGNTDSDDVAVVVEPADGTGSDGGSDGESDDDGSGPGDGDGSDESDTDGGTEVDADDGASEDGTDDSETGGGADDGSPGFGVAVALVGVVLGTAVVRRSAR